MHAALPSLLSHTSHLTGTHHLSSLRHSLAQIRATSCPSTSNPHSPISNPRHLAGNEWFPSSPLPSTAVHTNLVSAIPAWCSEPLHPPQCQELLHSSLHTQMCSSPLPARLEDAGGSPPGEAAPLLCWLPGKWETLCESWVHVSAQW